MNWENEQIEAIVYSETIVYILILIIVIFGPGIIDYLVDLF
jgi:hypothetical protein